MICQIGQIAQLTKSTVLAISIVCSETCSISCPCAMNCEKQSYYMDTY